ncbi:MAG: hypothetical protein DCC71_12205 [Proteobacteria bacterium]|nr:MAG: hypothetical protein DCC71_12205 [Pseudomonadota bacterium]
MANREIVDEDVRLLAGIASTLSVEYAAEDLAWAGSPFGWIKTRPSRQVGTIGEKLLAGYLAAKDFDVVKCPDSDADRIVSGVRAEIKFSTLWREGFYMFQQLRDQNYAVAICLGLSPFDAHCWAIPKPVIMAGIGKVEGLAPQHGGARGRDTAWLQVNPLAIPAWLGPYGGSLRRATEVLRGMVGRGGGRAR